MENAVGVLWIVLFDGCLGELLLEIYHFLQHPSLHHFVHTCVASLVQHVLRTLNPDHSYVISRIPEWASKKCIVGLVRVSILASFSLFTKYFRVRPFLLLVNLEGSQSFAALVRVNLLRSLWIYLKIDKPRRSIWPI